MQTIVPVNIDPQFFRRERFVVIVLEPVYVATFVRLELLKISEPQVLPLLPDFF